MRFKKGYIEICSLYRKESHSTWLCDLLKLYYLEMSLCFAFSFNKLYYDGWNYRLELGIIRFNWEQ